MTAPETATETEFGFTLTHPEDADRVLTFDTGGFIFAPDVTGGGDGYPLTPDEARHLAAALLNFAAAFEAATS